MAEKTHANIDADIVYKCPECGKTIESLQIRDAVIYCTKHEPSVQYERSDTSE